MIMNRLLQRHKVRKAEDFSLVGDLPSLKLWQGKEAGKRKTLQLCVLAD